MLTSTLLPSYEGAAPNGALAVVRWEQHLPLEWQGMEGSWAEITVAELERCESLSATVPS